MAIRNLLLANVIGNEQTKVYLLGFFCGFHSDTFSLALPVSGG
jgi:hypothetical protein